MLHLYSAESDLSAQNRARQIYYQWKTGPSVNTKRTIPAGALVIEVDALVSAVEQSIHRFIAASETDAQTKASVKAHLPSMLCYEPHPAQAMRQTI